MKANAYSINGDPMPCRRANTARRLQAGRELPVLGPSRRLARLSGGTGGGPSSSVKVRA